MCANFIAEMIIKSKIMKLCHENFFKKVRKYRDLIKRRIYPADNCMFKVNNGSLRTGYGICSKLTIKTLEQRD